MPMEEFQCTSIPKIGPTLVPEVLKIATAHSGRHRRRIVGILRLKPRKPGIQQYRQAAH